MTRGRLLIFVALITGILLGVGCVRWGSRFTVLAPEDPVALTPTSGLHVPGAKERFEIRASSDSLIIVFSTQQAPSQSSAVGKNCGGFRTFVACSKA